MATTSPILTPYVAKVAFGFDTIYPYILQVIEGGAVVARMKVQIMTPFNDPTASLSFGSDQSPSLFLGSEDSDLQTYGEYENPGSVPLLIDGRLVLMVSGSSTQGSGYLIYEITR
jgi:hypothetical protein